MEYPTPLDLRWEEKLIGGSISVRQLLYLVVPCVLAYVASKAFGGTALVVALGVCFVVLLPFAALLGFGKAGVLGLPGPPVSRIAEDPMQEAMGVDAWLMIVLRHRRKRPFLPFLEPSKARP